MLHTSYRDKYCVIGAGPSGLTVAKNLLQHNIPFDCIEKENDVGGNWYYGSSASGVYRSTHLISSKRMTEFTDFPMPEYFPPYPSHVQALDYLRSYASHFAVTDHVEFNATVLHCEPKPDHWQVTVQHQDNAAPEVRDYRGLIVANGHHWDPLIPKWAGDFNGDCFHSHDYRTPDRFAGRRVLVVGAGNSGCDIAVESASVADATFLSMRRGYYFLPKFLFGKPSDRLGDLMLRWHVPRWLHRLATRFVVRIAVGPPHRYGFPPPNHRLFQSHPIINSHILHYAGHGRITPKPDIKSLAGNHVEFADGSEERIDTIVCATGYRVSFPFLDRNWILDDEGNPKLFLNAFHPDRDDLFVAGLIQPNSGQWGITDCQSQLIAAMIVATDQKDPIADWFGDLKRQVTADRDPSFLDSPRHALEVDYFAYRTQLERLLKKVRFL